MTYCNTIIEHFAHLAAGFSSKKTLMCSMRQVFRDRANDAEACMASRQHFADTVCKIRRVVPALLLPDQKVVRAGEP